MKWTRLSNHSQVSVKRPGGRPQAALSQRDRAKIAAALEMPRPCLLCNKPPALAGLFWPDTPALWGGQLGKGRVIVYCLCADCRAVPDVTLRIEARLAASIVGHCN